MWNKVLTSYFYLLLGLSCCTSAVFAASTADTVAFWNDFEPNSQLKINHSAWQNLLQKHVIIDHPSGINRFNYAAVTSQDKTELGDYLVFLQGFDPRQLNKREQMAFWLNLYNASVVQIILKNGIPEKTNNIDDMLAKPRFSITLQEMSLDDIQNKILRPIYNDPRIHFALNSGALSSGIIQPVVYQGDNLDEVLDKAAKQYLNASINVDNQGSNLLLSKIFKWYRVDFASNTRDLKRYLNKYALPDKAGKIASTRRIRYKYDWNLNQP